MENNLQKIERSLRSMAKRYKTVKYSTGLAILFLMLGVNAFSEEVNSAEFIEQSRATRGTMKDTIENMHSKIEAVKAENSKNLAGAKLELIKLIEQGDQVVKSPWKSWQFGANYFYSNWRGTYEGKGDKKEKYSFEGVFTRSEDLFLRNIHPDSKYYTKYTSLPQIGAHSLSTFSVGASSPSKSFVEAKKENKEDPNSATTTLRGKNGVSYGLENAIIRQEDIAKIELGVTVKPKEVEKNLIKIQEPKKPEVNKPVVNLPEKPNAPETVETPEINAPMFTPITPKLRRANSGGIPDSNIEISAYGNSLKDISIDGNDTVFPENGGKFSGDENSYDHSIDYELTKSDIEKSGIRYTEKSSSDGRTGSALFRVFFDYGAKDSSIGSGRKTLTIKNGTNITLDSINNLTVTEKNSENVAGRSWNTGKFFTGGSRVGTLDNAVDAKMVNKGTINLVGPLAMAFEAQTDKIGSKKRSIINEIGGQITDEAETGYRGNDGLGGLQVGKVDENGNEVESPEGEKKSTKIFLPSSNDRTKTENTNRQLTISRTPDVVNSKGEIIKKGGYTGYKVGLILTYEESDDRAASNYEVINKGNIDFSGRNSMGIQIFASRSINTPVSVKNEGTISLAGKESYGMKLSSNISKKSTFENSEGGTINITGGNGKNSSKSVGIAVIEGEINQTKADLPIEKLNAEVKGAYIRAHKGLIKNKGTINVSGGTGNIGMFLQLKGVFQNEITNANLISVGGTGNIGMKVVGGVIDAGDIEWEEKPVGYLISDPIDGLPQIYNKKNIELKDTDNIGMVAEGYAYAENAKDAKILIKGGKRNIGMLSESKIEPPGTEPGPDIYERGIINNEGVIKTEKATEGAVGMAILSGSENSRTRNRGTIDLEGKEVVGVYHWGIEKNGTDDNKYVNSIFKMENPSTGKASISVNGENSIAVYSRGKNNKTLIEAGDISSEGGIGLYADSSAIELGQAGVTEINQSNSPSLITKNKGLMFYNYSHTEEDGKEKTPVIDGNFVLNNSVNGTVKNGGAAFYLRSSNIKKADFLDEMFTNVEKNGKVSTAGKKLNLKMEDGSTLFVIQNNNIDDVTAFQSLNAFGKSGLKSYGNRVVIDDNSSKKYKIEKTLRGKLLVDTNVNLDDNTEVYNRLEYLSSWVTVNQGIKMSSAQDNKVAVFQTNLKREANSKLAVPKVEDIKLINQGNISLTGKKSIGLAASFGLVTNSGNISVTGEKGVGIYAADSSVVENTGNIEVGSKGTAIYAENDLKVNNEKTAISAKKNINVTNKGNIKAKAGSTAVYGIYAKNDVDNYKDATSTIIHSGNIDLSKAKSSVGIYTENGTLTSSGKISVGKDSIGINAINSKVELKENSSITTDSAIGILAKKTELKSSADISIKNGIGMDIDESKVDIKKGKYKIDKSVAFKIANLGSNGYFKGNAGSINIEGEGSVAYHLKGVNLTSNNNFIDKLELTSNAKYTYLYLEDSALNYENKKTINNDGTTFIYAKNSDVTLKENTSISSSNKNVTAIYSEEATAKSILNKGKIKLLGEKSLGIYVKGANKLENSANIEVGGNSTAIYAKDIVNTVKNTGDIKLGTNSTGISAINSGLINSANIESEGTASIKNIAIYSSGNKGLTNTGNIKLLGNQSTGIYSDGADVVNSGKIKIGDSTDLKNPSIGIYAKNSKVENSAEINVGNKSVGIYGTNIDLTGNAKISSGDEGTALYSTGGTVKLGNNSQIQVGNNGATGLYYAGKDGSIINNAEKVIIGNNSYGFIVKGQKNKFESNTSNVTLGDKSIYAYSTDSEGVITNRTNISSSGKENYGIYSSGKVDNYGNIDFSSAEGSIGMYSYYPKNDSYSTLATSPINVPVVTNHSGKIIKVSKSNLSDSKNERYGIGMAAGHTEVSNGLVKQKAIGHIVNYGTISVTNGNSIGMYATGRGSIAENRGRIELSGKERNIGMFLENGAIGYNHGTITTIGNENDNKEQIGVVVTTGAKIVNTGSIKIHAKNGIGIYNFGGGIIDNRGTFDISELSTNVKALDQADTSKGIGGVKIQVRPDDKSKADIYVNGKKVQPNIVHTIPNRKPSEIPVSSVGIYMSSSGINPTRPIGNLGALAKSGIQSADLIIGTEATEFTNSKYIQLGQDLIKPYNVMIKEALKKGINKWEIYSGALTWQATVTQNKADQTIQNAYLTKIPYTVFAGDKNTTRDTYNFTDGLEQRYGIESLSSKEKQLFNKLNSIGNNEGILLSQAFDEMMGHQYANLHQRVRSTGDILDKEFNHLQRDWATASKKSNKLKTFGARGEYKTNTVGIIDYTNNTYGVAYVHENESIKLGKTIGWYTGVVHNTYKFKDIGHSKEEMLQAKVGIFKSIPFDDDNSLNWTVSGDISVGYNKMHRKYLVVNEIFNARSKYYNYGIALKNEVSKDFRLSESISIKPYGALKVEYGKIEKIKEKSGEVRLDVKESHYTSIKPEAGVEISYKNILTSGKVLTARVGMAYENEVGKVAKAKNKARVAYTNADWFNLPKEKEDRTGNVKTDFNIGVEGEILGGTANIGYDTKGHNIRGGIGIRMIF